MVNGGGGGGGPGRGVVVGGGVGRCPEVPDVRVVVVQHLSRGGGGGGGGGRSQNRRPVVWCSRVRNVVGGVVPGGEKGSSRVG